MKKKIRDITIPDLNRKEPFAWRPGDSQLRKNLRIAFEKISPEMVKILDREAEWLGSLTDGTDKDNMRAIYKIYRGLTPDEFKAFCDGYKLAADKYTSIIRKLNSELFEVLHRTKKKKRLQGKPKEIYNDTKQRNEFKTLYYKNSKNELRKLFGLSADGVDSLAEALELPQKTNKTVR
jgi:hypothetical protein